MFSIVLHQPEIPPNTGNVIRLCANTGCDLHLIEPLGFSLDEKQTRRAGLDYHDLARVKTWADWEAFRSAHGGRVVSFSTRNTRVYSRFAFEADDILLFGSETSGLPDNVFDSIPEECRLHVPMRAQSRSLNLSNTVALAIYEAWRQQDFAGSA